MLTKRATASPLAFESYSPEAIFHCNFPPLAHPSSTSIIREALTLYVGEGKPWHFEQMDVCQGHGEHLQHSQHGHAAPLERARKACVHVRVICNNRF